jgi:hypothetical protein
MTQRKTGAAHKHEPVTPPRERFARPDAETAAEGAPAHEQEQGAGPPAAGDVKDNDRAHGYSQDSGYQGSGGYTAKPAEPDNDGAPKRGNGHSNGNGHAHTDAQIGKDVQKHLLGQPAPRAGRLLVSVGDGVVTLSGEVDSEAERTRLMDLVRSVPSVREVRDELSVDAGGLPN